MTPRNVPRFNALSISCALVIIVFSPKNDCPTLAIGYAARLRRNANCQFNAAMPTLSGVIAYTL
jgi:hypothetical protein